jgi:hypothetical protein
MQTGKAEQQTRLTGTTDFPTRLTPPAELQTLSRNAAEWERQSTAVEQPSEGQRLVEPEAAENSSPAERVLTPVTYTRREAADVVPPNPAPASASSSPSPETERIAVYRAMSREAAKTAAPTASRLQAREPHLTETRQASEMPIAPEVPKSSDIPKHEASRETDGTQRFHAFIRPEPAARVTTPAPADGVVRIEPLAAVHQSPAADSPVEAEPAREGDTKEETAVPRLRAQLSPVHKTAEQPHAVSASSSETVELQQPAARDGGGNAREREPDRREQIRPAGEATERAPAEPLRRTMQQRFNQKRRLAGRRRFSMSRHPTQ